MPLDKQDLMRRMTAFFRGHKSRIQLLAQQTSGIRPETARALAPPPSAPFVELEPLAGTRELCVKAVTIVPWAEVIASTPGMDDDTWDVFKRQAQAVKGSSGLAIAVFVCEDIVRLVPAVFTGEWPEERISIDCDSVKYLQDGTLQ